MRKALLKMGIIGGLALTVLTGCQGQEEITEINIGYFPNITHTQALVMKGQGTLEEKWKDKYTVNWTSFNAGPAEVEALFAEEIDIGYIGPVPAINAFVKSEGDVQIISSATDGGAVLLKSPGSDIQTVADLEGKKIAIPQVGNTQHLCLLNLLEENGLSGSVERGDTQVIAVQNSDVMNMMDQGNIDAALVPEPWGSILESTSDAELVLDYDQVFLEGNYPTAVVVVRKDFMEDHPELVKAFLEEHEAATAYIKEKPEELYELINQVIEEDTSKTYDLEVLKSAFNRLNANTAINEEAIDKFGEICYNQGFITSELKDGIIGEMP